MADALSLAPLTAFAISDSFISLFKPDLLCFNLDEFHKVEKSLRN